MFNLIVVLLMQFLSRTLIDNKRSLHVLLMLLRLEAQDET
jgi:hypothetical protein